MYHRRAVAFRRITNLLRMNTPKEKISLIIRSFTEKSLPWFSFQVKLSFAT
jgi:hypothetical protein